MPRVDVRLRWCTLNALTEKSMAASRTDGWSENPVLVVESGNYRFGLPSDHVQVRKNGVEFWSPTPFELWTEMVVVVGQASSPAQPAGSGVVVACEGDRHRGYSVSVLFLEGAPEPGDAWRTTNPALWS